MMGGIRIDERAESSIKGLYACGEVSAGVHGANRMGSNSLADTQVFGKLAGMHAALHASQNEAPPIDMEDAEKECERVNDLLALGNKNGIKPVDIKSRIRQLMSEYVGVIRSGEGLRKAIAELDRISREDLSHAYIACKTRCYNNSWIELLETCNMVLVSKMIARSALNRTETRGAHYREDFPGRDDQKFLFHISVKKVNNEMRLSKLPITVSN